MPAGIEGPELPKYLILRTAVAKWLPSIAHFSVSRGNRNIRLVGQPVTLSRTPSKMAARPPEFGEQTDEVLAEFGFTPDEIGALRRDKVV